MVFRYFSRVNSLKKHTVISTLAFYRFHFYIKYKWKEYLIQIKQKFVLPHVVSVSCVLTSNDQTKSASRCWLKKSLKKNSKHFYLFCNMHMSPRLPQLSRSFTLHVSDTTIPYEDNCKPGPMLASVHRT